MGICEILTDDRINFHRLGDDYLEEPDEDEVPDDNIIYLNKEEQSTDD